MNQIRVKLDEQVQKNLSIFERVYAQLKQLSHLNWYPHLTIESRAKTNFQVNMRGQNVSDSIDQGVMIRIFDGETLYETAVDDFNEVILMAQVESLVKKVKQFGKAQPAQKVYQPSSWQQRIKANLEKEILSQIPQSLDSKQWVHFGTLQKKSLWQTDDEKMQYAKSVYHKLLQRADSIPLMDEAHQPDFCSVRLSLERINHCFIDEEVKMSQALSRNAVFLSAIKGEDRGSFVKGGLGGQETVEIFEREYSEVYEHLSKMLRAQRLEPGRYKVVMAPSISGVFAHEAFGHTQEGDTWARGRSKARELFERKIKVGNEHATIVNNPAIFDNGEDPFAAWGSYFFDEEGWLAQKHLLVENGWLKEPMTNLTSAIRLGVPRTANGKRESWTNAIYTRQTNTYFSEGDLTFDELLKQVDYGFLATTCFGGMEDPKGMGIQVGMGYLEEIKDGKLTGRTFKAPNGGAVQMTGYVPDYLNAILGKSKIEAFKKDKDKSIHPWNEVGGCGKYHKEFVVAGCGGPYMLVDKVLLG